MMLSSDQLKAIETKSTPFYYYDLDLLRATLSALNSAKGAYHVHYALKANANPVLLKEIQTAGLGADCVSGNEVTRALECGFSARSIAFAGVGKSDTEIITGLKAGIFAFNVESIPELEVINELAGKVGKIAAVALRINPNVDAYTHKYITTGLEENKFGINPHEFEAVLNKLATLPNLRLEGLHFHIGSQIQDLSVFKNLCLRINEINKWFLQKGATIAYINAGGGLGVNYHEPDQNSIPDFASFFGVFRTFLDLQPQQDVHFELGRCIIAQCGSLISKVLYVKQGVNTNFAILDAGMTELIRPALYQAYHKIENLSVSATCDHKYDVVGPVCESSDCFGKAVLLPPSKRGDLFAIRTAGAYGEAMSNNYNLRSAEAPFYFSTTSK